VTITFYSLAYFFCVATALPFLRNNAWWIRIFEFPRAQILLIGLISLIFSHQAEHKSIHFIVVMFLVIICLFIQIRKILPFTRWYPSQMQTAKSPDQSSSIKIIIANVFMENKEFDALVQIIQQHSPDIFLAVEVNATWYHQLKRKTDYKYDIAIPLDNTYGMVLFSNYELSHQEIKYLVEDDVPSIHTKVTLPSGDTINLICLHPKPPAPQENTETTERDAELLLVGKSSKQLEGATIIAGDLNDVAWSYTTTLFQKSSGLLDPRVGRGMFNSFNAKNPFMRFPLDHVFASNNFLLQNIKRLPAFGSDHFPILAEMMLSKNAETHQSAPSASREDKKDINKKIQKGQSA
jgi:endonuclease/exonuclease/phosphatase (EEP) superfamily protein YafD